MAVMQEREIGSRTVRSAVLTKRRVSFQPEVSVVETPSDPAGRKAFWYQPADFASFKEERLDTVRALKYAHGDLSCLDPSIYCLRGLEQKIFTTLGREQRSQQLAIIRAVLRAQQKQRKSGVKDPETIKSLSMVFSKLSRDRAVEMAELDARACQQQRRVQQARHRKRRSLVDQPVPKRRQVASKPAPVPSGYPPLRPA